MLGAFTEQDRFIHNSPKQKVQERSRPGTYILGFLAVIRRGELLDVPGNALFQLSEMHKGTWALPST